MLIMTAIDNMCIYFNCISCLGGQITLEDLANYYSLEKEPVTIHLNNGNLDVFGPPPPASGVIMGFIMNVLDGK